MKDVDLMGIITPAMTFYYSEIYVSWVGRHSELKLQRYCFKPAAS